MKRVLHITKRFPPFVGGIETVCHDMVYALKGKYEQTVISYNDKKETIYEDQDGFSVIRVGVERVLFSQPLSKSYKRVLYETFSKFKPDIIHFDYPNPFAAHFLLAAIKKFKYRGKVLLFWHSDIVKQKVIRLFFNPQTKKLLRVADRIIATSPNYLADTSFLPKVAKDKIDIVPLRVGEKRLLVDDQTNQKALKIKESLSNQKIVFFFGRHVPYKGLEYLIQANKHLNQNRIKILIGGVGPLTESLKKDCINMPNVVFLGRLDDMEINCYLLSCDIFAFPSITRNEAFGISLAEALFYGKPSVTFTIKGSGVNWVSPNGISGLEAPNRDAKALAKNISDLAENNSLYKTLSKNAKERANLLFSPQAFNKNICEVFKKL